MNRALVVIAAVGLIGGGAALGHSTVAPQQNTVDVPRHRGPDSARVASFLDAVAAADPVLCEMVSDQLGNFWFNGGPYEIGRFGDARPQDYAAKDSVARRVTDARSIRLLVSRLDTENSCARLVAAKMLGSSTVADAELARLLESPSARVREATLRGLSVRERPELRRAIERQVDASEPAVARMAVFALGHLEDRASVSRVRRELRSTAAPMRMTAAWALGMMEDQSVAADLEQVAREDADRRVRIVAIQALGDIEASRSFGPLVAMLNERDLEIATAAAEALGGIHAPGAVPDALLKAAESQHRPLRMAALDALSQFEDQAVVPVLLANITDPDPNIRVRMVEALGELKAMSALPALRRALNDPVADVRRAAVEALAEIADQ